MNKKLITQSYACTEKDTYELLYYLFSKKNVSSGKTVYGLSIAQIHGDLLTSESAFISEDRQTVVSLIHTYAKSFVFPSTLPELVADRNFLLGLELECM